MGFIKEVLQNRKTEKGRTEATIFFANIFLIMCQIFLITIYAYVGHKALTIINVVEIIYFILCIRFCYKKPLQYVGITFLFILIHLIVGTVSFGWEPGYQNWLFAMLVAFFLPSYNPKMERRNYKSVTFFSSIILLTYFILLITCLFNNLDITRRLPHNIEVIMAYYNALITFFTIVMFTVYFTRSSKKKEIELVRKADFDELTNIYNRHALDEIGIKIIEKCKELNKPFSVAIIDIDFFKKVNDVYGHPSGDLVLKKLADILRGYASSNFMVGRWGGEEFVIIGSHELKYNEFVKYVKQIREKVAKAKFITEDKKKINITISGGCASIYNFDSLEKAVSIADNNLYNAKETGRNKIVG